MRRFVVAVVAMFIALFAVIGFGLTHAHALDPHHASPSQDKVWVCKYVGKPGVDERPKAGKNPIHVNDASTNEHEELGYAFADAQGRSVIVAGEDSSCTQATTTTTAGGGSTSTSVSTTVTTAPPETTSTVPSTCEEQEGCPLPTTSSTSTSTTTVSTTSTTPGSTAPSTSTTRHLPSGTPTVPRAPGTPTRNAGTTNTPASLAFTGSSDIIAGLGAGLVVLLLGLAAILFSPKRRD